MTYAYGILSMLWLLLSLASIIVLPVNMGMVVAPACSLMALYCIARSSQY